MITNIKIFKHCEDFHGSYFDPEPMSQNDCDISIDHTSYNDFINQIIKNANNFFLNVKILQIWQKQGGQTLDITRENYGRRLSNIKICVLLKINGNSSQADMETIMSHHKERIKKSERTKAEVDRVKEIAKWHAK